MYKYPTRISPTVRLVWRWDCAALFIVAVYENGREPDIYSKVEC